MAEKFRDCALNDPAEGELCLTPEVTRIVLEAAVPELIFEYGEVCVAVVTEELILLELAALKFYGCSDYAGNSDSYNGVPADDDSYLLEDAIPDLL